MREAVDYIRSRLPHRLTNADDNTVSTRIQSGVHRARAAGFCEPAAIRLYVLMMFALEPEFDQRARVREYFAQRNRSLDEHLLRMTEWSYPNCWYPADPAFTEDRWRALAGSDGSNDSIPWPQDDPLPDQLKAGYGFQLDVPFFATPTAVVDAMLDLAEVRRSDLLADLGCGDGRIAIAAAARFGARALGIDLDPDQLVRAREAAQVAGVSDRTVFLRQDVLDADVSEATVVTLFLLRDINIRLREKLRQQLRPGARIVSRSFDMGDWIAEKVIEMPGERIFRWTV